MDSLHTRAQNDSPGANASSVKSDDSSPCHDPGRGSPPPNCAICLGTCRNKSFTDSCLHQFCFKCLLTWSKVKAECPLCKQNFRSIIHNVRSNHQYEEYMVEQRHTEEISERIDIDSLHTRRFRYRTTLTLPRQDSIAIQQLLLHYPMVAELFPSPRAPRRRSPASFRRTVYRYNLWARPLPDFTRRFRDCSPEFYRHNTSQMHRLVPWLNRELHYLLNGNTGHISYVVSRILELLPRYSIISPEFREAMHRYFGDNTDHFLHELYCYASTPYDMNGYDRNVQYTTDNTISTMVNEVLSSSESEASVDSDIVMISSSAPADPPPGPSRAPAPVYPQSYITQPTDGIIPIETISQSDTDDDSSEVMVVGYIKPPQDRTPEVVDLLGSDSDVIVQDSTLPEPPDATDASDSRLSSLVKLTLKRHDAGAAPDSDSDASFYTPSPSPPRPAPRRRRCRSDDSATTADTRRTTPSPASSLTTAASDYSFSDTDSSSDSFVRNSTERVKRKKARRKLTCSERNYKSKTRRRPSRAHRKSKKDSNASPGKDRQSKRKSHEGKGVKSSKKYTAADDASTAEPERAHAAPGLPATNEIVTDWKRAPEPPGSNGSVVDMKREPDQPGTSAPVNDRKRATEEPGTSGVIKKRTPEQPGMNGVVNDRKRKMERSSRRRKASRETKRLKSVVNVINSMNNAEPSKQSDGSDWSGESQAAEREPARGYCSDSSDDLPLNLSIKKGSRQ